MTSETDGRAPPMLVPIAVITAVALALRLPLWGNSLFGDEVGSYFVITGNTPSGIVHLLSGHSVDLTPPLYYLLSWLAERLGSSPNLLRLFPLLAGTATIPLTYLVGRRTVGTRAGVTAATLVAVSPFLIFYSTEARAYAVLTALVLCATFALLRAIDEGRWWWGYALASCAAVYTHYTAVFPLLALLIWALVRHRDRWRPVVVANVAAAIGFAPWLPTLVRNSRSFGTKVFGILEPFDAHAVTHDIAHWTVGHPYLTLATLPGTVAGVAIVLGLLIAAASVLAHPGTVPARLRGFVASPALVPVLLALALPVGMAIYSALGSSVWDLRNLIASTPGVALTVGALLAAAPRRAALVATALVAGGLASGAVRLLSADNQRPDYTAAARFIRAEGGRYAPVAVVPAPTRDRCRRWTRHSRTTAARASRCYASPRRRSARFSPRLRMPRCWPRHPRSWLSKPSPKRHWAGFSSSSLARPRRRTWRPGGRLIRARPSDRSSAPG